MSDLTYLEYNEIKRVNKSMPVCDKSKRTVKEHLKQQYVTLGK